MISKFIFTLVIIFLGAIGFAQTEKIFVSNYPLAYFAERILGEQIYFPEIEGDPAFWEPSEEELANIQAAELIILNGATYEKWRFFTSLPESKVVETANVFNDHFIYAENEVTHSHGSSGEHSHSGTTFTTWIDFDQASKQAGAIKDALIDFTVGDATTISENFELLKADLSKLDSELLELTQGYSELPLIGSHPIYQYFARRYDLNVKTVHWEPDTYPGEDLWQELETVLADHPAKWFIWEAEPLAESVARLEEMGLNSVVFDPSGNRPSSGDFLTVMQENIENLKPVFAH